MKTTAASVGLLALLIAWTPSTASADQHNRVVQIIKQESRGIIDWRFVYAVAKHESNLNPKAVSHAGAIGVMQLMPATAKELRVNPWHARQNIRGGISYLVQMLRRFGGARKALWAYNCGPGCVERERIPAESHRYADQVLQTYRRVSY